MKKPILIAGIIVLAALPVMAQNPNITLTPSSLYGMIEKLKVQAEKLTGVALRQNQRQQLNEKRLDSLEREVLKQRDQVASLEHKVKRLVDTALAAGRNRNQKEEQLAEIERRLAGVQKQVTVLHAKKADK